MKKIIKYFTDKKFRFNVNRKLGFYNKMSDEEFLKKAFKVYEGYELNLENPLTYDEKLQWLKLYDRNPMYSVFVDKLAVRKYVQDKIGGEYLIPIIGEWTDPKDIDFSKLPNQFVLKCTHDSGGLFVCRDKQLVDFNIVIKKIAKYLRRDYYKQWREYPYKNVPHKVIAEEFINPIEPRYKIDSNENFIFAENLQWEQGLLDYKFMCFNGVVKALFLDIGVVKNSDGHAGQYYRNVYARDFNLLPVRETRENIRNI